MRAILARERPEDAILGEEYGVQPGRSGLTWVLDPIDGTRAYLCGAPTWGVLIGLSDADAVLCTEGDPARVRPLASVSKPLAALGVLVADCTPVLVHDTGSCLVGVAHAGRPGMVAGVALRLVEAMRDLGAVDLRATVGPSVCGRCYEVPDEMRAEAARENPAAYATTWQGTAAVDVAAGGITLTCGGTDVAGVPRRYERKTCFAARTTISCIATRRETRSV